VLFSAPVTLLAIACPVLAQTAQVPAPNVSIKVNVVDGNGQTVPGLTRDNFRVRLNGKPAALLDAHYGVVPGRIVVLLDVSGSMTAQVASAKWEIAREAALDLLTHQRDDVPIALLTFSRQVRDRFDFHQGREAITKWLEERPAAPFSKGDNRTALFDAVSDALQLLQPYQLGDVVYAITDGGDNASKTSAASLRAALLNSGVRLFAFSFAEHTSIPIEGPEIEHEHSFFKLIEDSGGIAFGVWGQQLLPPGDFEFVNDKHNQETVAKSSRRLSVLVHDFWTLDLVAPSNKPPSVTLEVIDSQGKVRKDVTAIYPHVLPGVGAVQSQ
jgi:hypothetical protein